MKIVFDTNVLLNAILNRPGRSEALLLMLAVCAARGEADYIATCDQGFLRADSPVPARTPEDLLAMMEQRL